MFRRLLFLSALVWLGKKGHDLLMAAQVDAAVRGGSPGGSSGDHPTTSDAFAAGGNGSPVSPASALRELAAQPKPVRFPTSADHGHAAEPESADLSGSA